MKVPRFCTLRLRFFLFSTFTVSQMCLENSMVAFRYHKQTQMTHIELFWAILCNTVASVTRTRPLCRYETFRFLQTFVLLFFLHPTASFDVPVTGWCEETRCRSAMHPGTIRYCPPADNIYCFNWLHLLSQHRLFIHIKGDEFSL